MELPDDFFTEDDAADDNTQTIRRWMEEETNAMTLFMLEDVDAGETLRIETSEINDLAVTVTDEAGAATIHLTPGQAELLATWLLTRNQADE